jgi:multiple sugar transport system permease protein
MLDGAGAWRRLLAVTIPAIRHPLNFVISTTAILSFRLFDQVYVLPTSPGGPRSATSTMMLYIVQLSQGSATSPVGLAAAATVIFLLIVLATSVLQRRFEPKD